MKTYLLPFIVVTGILLPFGAFAKSACGESVRYYYTDMPNVNIKEQPVLQYLSEWNEEYRVHSFNPNDLGIGGGNCRAFFQPFDLSASLEAGSLTKEDWIKAAEMEDGKSKVLVTLMDKVSSGACGGPEEQGMAERRGNIETYKNNAEVFRCYAKMSAKKGPKSKRVKVH